MVETFLRFILFCLPKTYSGCDHRGKWEPAHETNLYTNETLHLKSSSFIRSDASHDQFTLFLKYGSGWGHRRSWNRFRCSSLMDFCFVFVYLRVHDKINRIKMETKFLTKLDISVARSPAIGLNRDFSWDSFDSLRRTREKYSSTLWWNRVSVNCWSFSLFYSSRDVPFSVIKIKEDSPQVVDLNHQEVSILGMPGLAYAWTQSSPKLGKPTEPTLRGHPTRYPVPSSRPQKSQNHRFHHWKPTSNRQPADKVPSKI